MKLFKKIAVLGLALLTCLSFGILSACDNSSNSSNSSEGSSDPALFIYRVKVQNATGGGLRGVKVGLYDGKEKIAEKTSNANGYASFDESDIKKLDEYEIRVSNIPTGYVMAEPDKTYITGAWEGFEASVQLDPTGVIKETAPIGTGYSLGDVMYDFTVTTSDGEEFTLSEALKEKDMVLINFWATWCGPCKQEFPAMNNAYISYQDQIEVLAISTTDTMQAVREFKSNSGLAFDMTSNSESGANIAGMFDTSAIPLSIIVDRYGVVADYHTGSLELASQFTSKFDRFLGEDYQPTLITSEEGGSGGGSDEGQSNLIKPTVGNPSVSKINNVLTGGNKEFKFSWAEDDEYSWPWLIEDGYIHSPVATNSLHGNYSTLNATFTAGPGDALFFDYMVNTEPDDILYVLVDDVPVQQLSGHNNDQIWTNDFGAYVFREYETEGTHTLTLLYLKDSSGGIDREGVWLKDLRIEQNANNVNSNVFRHAANVLNEDENATTMYKHYADVVLNETDGYYHVGTKDGPLLFANLMLSSRWSNQSVWNLAYSGYIVVDGYNFSGDIEEFAWGANQPIPDKQLTYGYTPVTEELKELLIYATKSNAVGENGYKNWTGDWYEDQWLEMCVYFENYGNAAPIEDPMKTITFHAAEQVYEGKNTANVLFAMTPRGFKYKFIPERSGVYNVYSVGQLDAVCFFFGESTTDYAYYDNVLGAAEEDFNFNFRVHMEAGKTYYLSMTTYLDVAGSYDFYINYVGATYSYMENCATGLYSYNEVSGELFLPDAIEYAYSDPEEGGDGYYHVVNADGTLGSIIYVDMTRPTHFANNSLYDIARTALNYELEDRAFYINGVDYSETIRNYGFQSLLNEGDFEGYMALDKELFDILVTITTSDRYEGIEDTWQLLCYYYTTLGA